MRIVPYRVLFEVDWDSGNDKMKFGKPTDHLLPVERSSDAKSYVIHTHDRGDSEGPGPFYQIAFRIEDPSPYEIRDLSLTLDSFLYNQIRRPKGTNLYCDEAFRLDPEKNLWYQQTRYSFDKKLGIWKVLGDTNAKSLPVDCITTAGVFKVYAQRNGVILPDVDIPWVYVLPSAITQEEYIDMLSDLLNLHERLIRKDSSTVGVGKNAYIARERNRLRNETDQIRELLHCIQSVMRLQSESLEKVHIKTSIRKVHHFDSKVIKDYISNGRSGKIYGVSYRENHDTYENRIIKYALLKIVARMQSVRQPPQLAPEALEAEVERRFAALFPANSAQNASSLLLPDWEESASMKEEIRARIQQEYAMTDLRRQQNAALQEAAILLQNPWFDGIAALSHVEFVERTPKFRNNPHYAKLYELLTGILSEHPLLLSSFDCNAFGVDSTERVYEVWTFYKMLHYLTTLGFELDSPETLTQHFQKFLNNSSSSKGFHIQASRKFLGQELRIEVGNERTFRAEIPGRKGALERKPDMYMKTFHGDTTYWYFFDAKYKTFSAKNPNKVNYYQEIYDVSVSKYIDTMEEIFRCNPVEFGPNNEIRGSYLFMADVDDANLALSENGRLFGGSESIFCKPILHRDCEGQHRIDNPHQLPSHRYGAILLKPGKEDELRSLFQMIFEYIEADGQQEHINLYVCWNCNSEKIEKKRKVTGRGIAKYYDICPQCRSFRTDTHCTNPKCRRSIIKHTFGNFHQLDPSIPGNRWAFSCPYCGAKLK